MARQTEKNARWSTQSNASGVKDAIRVLVADDHPVVRSGLYVCLSKHAGFKWVGEAADGQEAVDKTLRLRPDVVLMDLSMPRLNGFAATEMIRQQAPGVKVLALSVHNGRDYVFRSIQAGAHGFISKEVPTEDLLRAIEAVAAGGSFFTPEIAQAALEKMVQNGPRKEPLAQLTPREQEVLTLIAEGQTNKEIASRLGIGVRTVETHRERIMDRLSIDSVAGLTRFAIRHGLIHLDQPNHS